MKNLELTFLYVEDKNNNKQYTFVSIESDFIKSELAKMNHYNILDLNLNIVRENKHTIRVKADKKLHNICESIFSNTTYLRYNHYIAFNCDIDSPSFIKNILLDNALYEPTTDLEIVLSQLGILKAYYNNEVNFYIQNNREEFSSEFGQRVFSKLIEKDRIEYSHFTRGKSDYYNSSIYSSSSKEKVVKITGKNDLGKNINISENEIGMIVNHIIKKEQTTIKNPSCKC